MTHTALESTSLQGVDINCAEGQQLPLYMIALLCEAGEFDPREQNAANLFQFQAVQQGSPLCKTAFK